MKKSTLALSVAAAIGSFGFVGSAMAIGELGTASTTATAMVLNHDGIGHQLVVPYFSTQSANTTLLNISNTDSANGKVVKVRFRGAANSDDLFDFQLLLSPGDVWSAGISQDPATGLSLLRTPDASCTLPSTVRSATGQLFSTGRVDPTPTKGNSINETREGYVEIITMADVPMPAGYADMTDAQKAATLYGTIKHSASIAACNATVLGSTLGTDFATVSAANLKGLTNPTGKLAADWVILNQTTTAAWSGAAVALQATGGTGAANLVFWPQKDNFENGAPPLLASTAVQLANRLATTDPLFVTGVVTIQPFDLPDLSTPYTTLDNATTIALGDSVGPASTRADNTSSLLAVGSITNQFVTNSGIAGVTDMLFSQPTRRFSVAVNYTAGPVPASDLVGGVGTRAVAIYRGIDNLNGSGSATYTSTNSVLSARQVCLNSIPKPSLLNREEAKPSTEFIISPNIAAAFSLCGEAAIASINSAGVVAGSALSATVVRNDITFPTGFDLGIVTFNTLNGDDLSLPILGGTYMRVANGAINYGFTMPSKVIR